MLENLTEIGVGGIFALMVLDKVFGFVRATKNGRIQSVAAYCGFDSDRDEIRDLLKQIELNTRGLNGFRK